jgi:hypothetical protein
MRFDPPARTQEEAVLLAGDDSEIYAGLSSTFGTEYFGKLPVIREESGDSSTKLSDHAAAWQTTISAKLAEANAKLVAFNNENEQRRENLQVKLRSCRRRVTYCQCTFLFGLLLALLPPLFPTFLGFSTMFLGAVPTPLIGIVFLIVGSMTWQQALEKHVKPCRHEIASIPPPIPSWATIVPLARVQEHDIVIAIQDRDILNDLSIAVGPGFEANVKIAARNAANARRLAVLQPKVVAYQRTVKWRLAAICIGVVVFVSGCPVYNTNNIGSQSLGFVLMVAGGILTVFVAAFWGNDHRMTAKREIASIPPPLTFASGVQSDE